MSQARAADDALVAGAPERDLRASAPDGVLDEVALEVAAIVRRGGARWEDEVGEHVVARLFGGDPSAARIREPGSESLRRLGARLERLDALTAHAFRRCVAAHCVVARLGGITALRHVARSHVGAVLPLPEDDQLSLLREAERERWSVERLRERVAASPRHSGLGRPRLAGFVRGIRQLERVLDARGLAFRDLHRAAELPAEATDALHAAVVRAQERLERLRAALHPRRLEEMRDAARPRSAGHRLP